MDTRAGLDAVKMRTDPVIVKEIKMSAKTCVSEMQFVISCT